MIPRPLRTMSAPTTPTPATDRLAGRRTLLRRERELRRRVFRPPPSLTVSQWADHYRVLSRVSSAEPGQWRTDRAPYQRGVMDAFSDPTVERVVVMSSAQTLKTEVLLNTLGYFIDQDPAPILVMQPTKEMAQAFSTDRVKPMLQESPKLRGKVAESGRRHSGDTVLHKEFTGGHLTMTGANSAASLASRPIRVVLCDEVDRYPASAGEEGDPVSLAEKRTTTFWNRKVGLFSTPTIKGVSRIERAYEASDQRKLFVPCPDCGHQQLLLWANLKWDRDENGKPVPGSERYMCAGCGVLIEESRKYEMLCRGEAGEGGWIAQRPFTGTAGFWINMLYSVWATWWELIKEFELARKSPETLRVFVNTVLGESGEIDGDSVDIGTLDERRETYMAEVPKGVGILTAGVDVQRDRLELIVKGWGAGQESWLIAHHRIYGDPSVPNGPVWLALDALLTKTYKHEAGATLTIRATCVDSGDLTQSVYAFVRGRQRRGVYATKGLSVRGRPIISRPGKANKFGVKVVPIGTDTAKDVLFARLKNNTAGTPGYMHFPFKQADGADAEYMAQFAAEKAFIRRVKGVPQREYRAVRDRNEAIDLEIEALVALYLLGAGVYDQLGVWVERALAAARATPNVATPSAPEPSVPTTLIQPLTPQQQRRMPRSTGWVNKWRN